MSSLAAVQADGYYYDPSRFDPKKRGRDSVNALANSHPLGARAKRLKTEGILVVRFEMPHDVWCGGCGLHVARGVRFNADKTKCGMYFSTQLWEFRMRCTACPQVFVVRTRPQDGGDYDFVEGCRRQAKAFASDSHEAVALPTAAHKERLATDALYRVEHGADDARRGARAAERLTLLARDNERRHGEGRADLIAAARARLREEREEERAQVAEGEAMGLAPGTRLLPGVEGEGGEEEEDGGEEEDDADGVRAALLRQRIRHLIGEETTDGAPSSSSSSSSSASANASASVVEARRRAAVLAAPILIARAAPLPQTSSSSSSSAAASASAPSWSAASATAGRARPRASAELPSPKVPPSSSSSSSSLLSIVMGGLSAVRAKEDGVRERAARAAGSGRGSVGGPGARRPGALMPAVVLAHGPAPALDGARARAGFADLTFGGANKGRAPAPGGRR